MIKNDKICWQQKKQAFPTGTKMKNKAGKMLTTETTMSDLLQLTVF